MNDNQKILIAILAVLGTGGAYWFYQRKQNQSAIEQAQAEQNPAAQAMANYAVPPDIGAQTTAQQVWNTTNGQGPYIQTTQTMPLPYNT